MLGSVMSDYDVLKRPTMIAGIAATFLVSASAFADRVHVNKNVHVVPAGDIDWLHLDLRLS